ncbi:MAG: hypothetical protein AAF668_17430 [Pseudomonadota bacterium]
MEIIFALLFLAFVLWLIWQLFALVGDMAERRGQDRLLWQVAALFINPFGAIILLWLFVSVRENP